MVGFRTTGTQKVLFGSSQNAALQSLFQLKHYGDNMKRLLAEMETAKYEKVTFEENR